MQPHDRATRLRQAVGIVAEAMANGPDKTSILHRLGEAIAAIEKHHITACCAVCSTTFHFPRRLVSAQRPLPTLCRRCADRQRAEARRIAASMSEIRTEDDVRRLARMIAARPHVITTLTPEQCAALGDLLLHVARAAEGTH